MKLDQAPSMRLLAGSFIAVGLSGCSWLGLGGDDGWFRDRQGEYLQAEVVPRMEIPSQLDAFTIDDLYRIPPETSGGGDLYVVPPAPKPIDTRVREGVVIQRFGDRAWIVIGATSDQVWPRLRDYWSEENVSLVSDDPVVGVMETEWLPMTDSTVRHKYRVTIEPGLHAGNSEVRVRHISDNGETPAGQPAVWASDSRNQERENTILITLSQYLADRTDIYRASSVSMLAGSIQAESKARLVSARGEDTRLELDLDFERAWGQVTQAIENAGIEIIRSDRDARLVHVAFSGAEEAEEPGFLGRLFGGDDEEQLTEFNVHLQDSNDGVISVNAEAVSGEAAARLQDLLIRTINDNLI